ncbi:MAG: hypothetical protein H6Q24_579, partial [Bacteroidetes bacterium]|nr:hypothetical protein [Bacteroidota bacterium]
NIVSNILFLFAVKHFKLQEAPQHRSTFLLNVLKLKEELNTKKRT